MATVVELLAKIRADSSQFTASVAKARDDIEKFEKSTKTASTNISNGLDQVNKRSVAIGAAIGTAIGQVATQAFMKAGQAAKQFIVDSIGGASDLNESTTKTEAVFGSATDVIMKFAEGAATAIGQSKQQALDAASTFGIYGRSAGLTGQALADFAMTQTALASDLASFYNKTPEEAIIALGAAFRGQAEPARAFGVLMDDMSMRAAAFKMGIISSTKEALTPQNKVLAANALIMEQTKVAQGDFAKTSAGLANQQRVLAAQIANTKTQFGQALLPTVLSVVAAFNTQVLPAFTSLAGSFKTLIEEIASRLAPTFENLKTIIGNVITAITPLVQIVGGLLAIAFVAVTSALDVLLPIVASITGFFAENQGILIAVAAAVGLVTAAVVGATIAFKIKTAVIKGITAVTKVYQVVQLLLRRGQLASIATTNGLAASMLVLNATLRANPIGAVVTVIMLLVAGFILAWKKSETFRKVVAKAFEMVANVVLFVVKGIIGYIKMMVNAWMSVAGFILKGAAKAFGWLPGIGDKIKGASEGFEDLKDGVNKTFDGIIKGAEGMKDKVVGAVNSAATAKDAVKPKPKAKDKKPVTDVPVVGTPVVDASGVTSKLAEMQKDIKKAVENYNDYLKKDFATSFMNGAEGASNAVFGALDKLEKVFEAKGKTLSGGALAQLRGSFDKVNAEVRGMIDGYAALAGEIEAVSKKLDKATDDLKKAIESRASAMKQFGDLMKTPFGEPSQIDKALRSAETSVESIIGMYDQLVQLVDQRFTELAPGARDAVKEFLYAQANGLIDAARMRVKAIKVLEASQKRLDDLVDNQKSFSKTLTSSIKSFATAVADLSKTDSKATITVIKTAAGLVITQLKQSAGGVDKITQQLKDRLSMVASFAVNAQKLLASGLNKEYVRQLLEAGPEAAGLAVTALASASAAQVAEINSLYEQIGVISDEFGTNISDKMYGEAIAMATSFRDGAALGVELINAAMSDIVTNINGILSVLGNTGLTNAQALVDALIAEFTRQANETVGPATQIIVDKIKTILGVMGAEGTTAAQAFINGLLAALTGKDNLAAIDLSATQIKTNVDTVMKALSPEAATNGLGLINSLIGAFGGTNLTNVTTSATAVKDSITTALSALTTLGTELATDLAQGAFDKLTAEKAALVALAESIAVAIAAAMAGAASGIGVIVDGATGDLAALNAQIAATAKAAAALAGAGDDDDKKDTNGGGKKDTNGGGKKDNNDKKYDNPATLFDKAFTVPKGFKSPKGISPRGNANNIDFFKKPVVTPTPKPTPVSRLAPVPATYGYGRSVAGVGTVANVTINTTKVVPVVTPTTIAKAVSKTATTAKRKK